MSYLKQLLKENITLRTEKILEIRGRKLGYVEEIYACFETCLKCWLDVRKRVVDYEFTAIEDEIYFFKHVKPVFVSELEYYSLVYFTEHFKPKENEFIFWRQEAFRLKKFKREYDEFYNYYKSNSKHHDTSYFVRVVGEEYANEMVHYYDPELTSSHDGLVSKILYLEKFDKYVQDKIRSLQRNPVRNNLSK